MIEGPERYPRENDADEKRLAEDLLKAAELDPVAAAQAVLALEGKHAARREMLWAKQGHAPLATALAHLAAIATASLLPLAGGSVAEAAGRYAESGWRVDAAARAPRWRLPNKQSLSNPSMPCWRHSIGVGWKSRPKASRHWLNRAATRTGACRKLATAPSFCSSMGFAFDLARELEANMAAGGDLDLTLEPGFTSIPSVTSSGKVWVSPACSLAAARQRPQLRAHIAQRRLHGGQAAQAAMESEVYAIVDRKARASPVARVGLNSPAISTMMATTRD